MEGFAEYRERVFRLYGEKSYSQALDVAREAAELFPAFDAKISFWIACFQSRLGHSDEAIRTLQSAVKRGVWWRSESLHDPDLSPISDRPEFKTIKTDCLRLSKDEPKEKKPELMVRVPSPVSEKDNPPVLMTFHMRYGERPELSAEPWTSVVTDGTVLAAPWSSQVYAYDGRCWDDLQLSERDLKWAFSELKTKYSLNLSKLILGGMSQGGGLSVHAALKRLVPCRGFIAVAPSDWVVPEKPAPERNRPSEAFSSFVKASDCRGVRGVVIIGDKDAFFPKIQELYELMTDRGLEGKLILERGLGHTYPEAFGSKLKEAVDFVLGPGRS